MKLRCPYLATNSHCTVPPISYPPTQANYKVSLCWTLVSGEAGLVVNGPHGAELETKGNEMKQHNTAFLVEEMHNLSAGCWMVKLSWFILLCCQLDFSGPFCDNNFTFLAAICTIAHGHSVAWSYDNAFVSLRGSEQAFGVWGIIWTFKLEWPTCQCLSWQI